MSRSRFAFLAVSGFLSLVPVVLAGQDAVVKRAAVRPLAGSITCPPGGGGCPSGASCYSQEVPVLARVQGRAFFRTAVVFQNNTNKDGVTVTYQFSYACISASCSPAGGFYRTTLQTITLLALDSFVQDDFIDYLNTQGLLQTGAEQGAIGTLLVFFDNLPSSNGWEANALARTYNRVVETDPTQGTVGFAYNASLFYESADTTLVGFGRDTQATPTIPIAGKIRTNVGIRNTDVCGSDTSMTVDITCYDTKTGKRVGNPITFLDLKSGEVRQVSDLWATAAITDPSVNDVIIFADARNPTATGPTMEGYITLVDGNTQDAALFEMKCATGCFGF